MLVTKEQLVKALVKYAKQEIVSNISDKASKMMVAVAVKAIEANTSLLDKVFDNQIVSMMIQGEDGKYNVENIMSIISSTMDEYGDFPVQLPLIKNQLLFNKRDITKLEDCIKEVVDNDRL